MNTNQQSHPLNFIGQKKFFFKRKKEKKVLIDTHHTPHAHTYPGEVPNEDGVLPVWFPGVYGGGLGGQGSVGGLVGHYPRLNSPG